MVAFKKVLDFKGKKKKYVYCTDTVKFRTMKANSQLPETQGTAENLPRAVIKPNKGCEYEWASHSLHFLPHTTMLPLQQCSAVLVRLFSGLY